MMIIVTLNMRMCGIVVRIECINNQLDQAVIEKRVDSGFAFCLNCVIYTAHNGNYGPDGL